MKQFKFINTRYMKKTYSVTATCSGTCGGNIARLSVNVEFDIDNDSMEEFFKNAQSKFFMMGYNILHWRAINDLEGARCIFVVPDNERICRRILKNCDEYAWASNNIKLIEDAENGKFVDGVKEYKGKLIYEGWTKDSLTALMLNAKNNVEVTCLVLDELGYDPNDNAGVRRVCNNIGIDSYRGNGTY